MACSELCSQTLWTFHCIIDYYTLPPPKKKKKATETPYYHRCHSGAHQLPCPLPHPQESINMQSLLQFNLLQLFSYVKQTHQIINKPFPLTVWYTLIVLVGLSIVTYIFALHSVFFCSLPTQNTLKVRNSIELSANWLEWYLKADLIGRKKLSFQ